MFIDSGILCPPIGTEIVIPLWKFSEVGSNCFLNSCSLYSISFWKFDSFSMFLNFVLIFDFNFGSDLKRFKAQKVYLRI